MLSRPHTPARSSPHYPFPLRPQAVYNGSHSTSGGTGAGVFDEAAGFAMVDTLFSLAEAYLYMQLVELKVRVY